jgi:hypothetical protein
MGDRRFEIRNPANEQVELCGLDESGANRTWTGTLHDLSKSGARIRLDRTIKINTKLRVKIREQELGAVIRSCAKTPSAYMLGIEFDSEYQGPTKTAT